MLDDLNVHIEEIEINYFDDYDNVWCVDAWWYNDSNVNTSYKNDDGDNNRGAVIATISEDGEELKWKDNFNEAITEDNDNSWVIEEIEDRMREIKSEYYKNH